MGIKIEFWDIWADQ